MRLALIISHKYKFIFLKTNKTASSSIEIALSKFCGSEDVITLITKDDDEIRRKLGYRGAQNHFIPISCYGLKAWRKLLFKGQRLKYNDHRAARQIKIDFGEEIWNTYYKFCVERNPWDRFISFYYWRNRSRPSGLPGFSEFLETKTVLGLQHRGFDLYTIDGEIAVDKICFYENLEEDLEEVRIKCGLPERLTLPNAKGSYRKDRRNYREVLSKDQAEKIGQLARKEIALFGYEY